MLHDLGATEPWTLIDLLFYNSSWEECGRGVPCTGKFRAIFGGFVLIVEKSNDYIGIQYLAVQIFVQA